MANFERLPESILWFYEMNQAASREYVENVESRKSFLRCHMFLFADHSCIDGRVSDFRHALGLPVGLLESYRSPGSKTDLGCLAFKNRLEAHLDRSERMNIFDSVQRRMYIHLETYHYSGTNPETASCAAWEHDIKKSRESCFNHARELNRAYQGELVAIPVGIDTDLDAFTIHGPKGQLSVVEYLDFKDDLLETLTRDLRTIFPNDWLPLRWLEGHFQHNFCLELAQRLVANVEFVRNVKKHGRAPELMEHNESLIFVGRHADWIHPDHQKSLFLLDDCVDEETLFRGFGIAVKHVTSTLLRRMISGLHDDELIIPVVVNVSYDKERRHESARAYVLHLVTRLAKRVESESDNYGSWIRFHLEKEVGQVPNWALKKLKEIPQRIFFSPSISYRKDRLFTPIQSSPSR